MDRNIAGRLMNDLQRDFGLTRDQAAGVVGNLAHESAGFKTLQEKGYQRYGPNARGGFGYAQWTGPRRNEFEAFTKERGLDPTSYEANYGFLAYEARNTEKNSFNKVKSATTPQKAAQVFSNSFLRPGDPKMESRINYAQQAVKLDPFMDQFEDIAAAPANVPTPTQAPRTFAAPVAQVERGLLAPAAPATPTFDTARLGSPAALGTQYSPTLQAAFEQKAPAPAFDTARLGAPSKPAFDPSRLGTPAPLGVQFSPTIQAAVEEQRTMPSMPNVAVAKGPRVDPVATAALTSPKASYTPAPAGMAAQYGALAQSMAPVGMMNLAGTKAFDPLQGTLMQAPAPAAIPSAMPAAPSMPSAPQAPAPSMPMAPQQVAQQQPQIAQQQPRQSAIERQSREKKDEKSASRQKTAAATTGALLGGMVLGGPIGGLLGGMLGATASNRGWFGMTPTAPQLTPYEQALARHTPGLAYPTAPRAPAQSLAGFANGFGTMDFGAALDGAYGGQAQSAAQGAQAGRGSLY